MIPVTLNLLNMGGATDPQLRKPLIVQVFEAAETSWRFFGCPWEEILLNMLGKSCAKLRASLNLSGFDYHLDLLNWLLNSILVHLKSGIHSSILNKNTLMYYIRMPRYNICLDTTFLTTIFLHPKFFGHKIFFYPIFF